MKSECGGVYSEKDKGCWLCSQVNLKSFRKCKRSHDTNLARTKRLAKIRENCPYVRINWDEYHEYKACVKDGHRLHPPSCVPEESCAKFAQDHQKSMKQEGD